MPTRASAWVGRDDPIMQATVAGRMVRVRRRGIPDAPMPFLPREGLPFWCHTLVQRCVNHYDAVVLITGKVGRGKSTLAIRMASACDPTFLPNLEKRLCYGPAALLSAYSTILPGQAVMFDEGVRGFFAGDQATREQKALIKALALVREKGAILFICAPSIWNIALQVRQHRATLWIEAMGRGVGRVHERDEQIHYTKDDSLGFFMSRRAPYALWDPYAPDSATWVAYKAEKDRQLAEFFEEALEDVGRGHKHSKGKGQGKDGGPMTSAEKQKRYRERKALRDESKHEDAPSLLKEDDSGDEDDE